MTDILTMIEFFAVVLCMVGLPTFCYIAYEVFNVRRNSK